MSHIYTSPLTSYEPRGWALIDVHPLDDGTDDDNFASSILSSVPRSLSLKSNAGLLSRGDEIWTIRQVSQGEEELFAKGKCVYWTRNQVILRSFNFTEHVVKVFWSKFANQEHLCVALNSSLSIFSPSGQHFQIPLPFSYRNIHSTRSGLIIERNCDPLDDSFLPLLFTLTHPTHEVSPLLFKATMSPSLSISTKSNIFPNCLTSSIPNYMSLVACHETLPLCLMYNAQDCQHSLWKIRPIKSDEVDDYNQNNDETTLNTFSHYQANRSLKDQTPSSLNFSNKQRSSLMLNSNPSSAADVIFSPKVDLRARSNLGNLAASRLGVGGHLMTPEASGSNLKSYNSNNTTSRNMMSTPNRNRIINYLRDNIEEPILPELICEQIWTESSNNSLKASKFFITNSLVGDRFMVIVIPNSTQLKMIKLNKDDINHGLSVDEVSIVTAVDAMPIPSMKMMIVIDINKNFILYSGTDRVTYVSVPQATGLNLRAVTCSSPAGNSSKNNYPDMTPIQMSSARKRSSMADRSFMPPDSSLHHIFQSLSPVPHAKQDSKLSSPMVLNDVKRIEHVIDRSVFVLTNGTQRARFDVPTICQTACVKRLLDAMMLLVPKDLGLDIVSKWYQCRRALNQPELMNAKDELKLFKDWFLCSLKLLGGVFDSDSPVVHEMSNRNMSSPVKRSRRAKETESNPMIANIYNLFLAMHLILEDLLLMKLNYEIASDLSELLIILACLLKLESYQVYYWLKFPQLQSKLANQKKSIELAISKYEYMPNKPSHFPEKPPSVIDFLKKIILKSQLGDDYRDGQLNPYPNLENVTSNIHTVISLFCEMFNLDRMSAILSWPNHSDKKFIDMDVLSGNPHRSKEADERFVLLMVKLGKTKSYLSRLPEAINLYFWDAILNCRELPPTDWNEACFELIGRLDLVSLVCGSAKSTQVNNGTLSLQRIDETLKLVFPDDIRVSECRRMLASDVPVEFSVTPRQGATEEESREEIHRHLYLLNVRSMAMPVGRGAMSLRTYSPVIGESFEVSRLDLSGKALPEDRLIEYNHDISLYPWPFFHNGVAAGLTICASTANNIIDSTWINYNRPRSNMPHGGDIRDRDFTTANTNNEHAGFLFALGLNGHLEKLSLMALHDYLCLNNDLTKLAILLGMSAARRGSRDNNIIKVLSIHVDALLPPNSTELDVPASVHAASIIGVGLLYQSSGDSHISKVLLEEIGRLPGPEANSHVDRESYSLSAGLAFGLVNLCKGGTSTISSSDQLRLYMLGGKRKPLTIAQRDRYFKQDCHRGEGEYINTHITSPGGTLGLGLMYHRSENQSVASWMRAPDTQTLLEYVRPDFLILRMVSYGLIMWNEVEASEDFINSHIPKIVSTHAFQRNSKQPNEELGTTAKSGPFIDYELISQTYCNIVAGCCMAIAMRYAGTANPEAYKTIYKHTKMLIVLSNKPSLAEQAGRPCIESCLNVLVTSLAVLMAGTGDLGVLRICRYLRSRLSQNCVLYGSYLAIHMALGILFLGSCRYSFSTNPEAIAALVCALYPIYPNHSSDNRFHLQALRHLYVLAAEPRLLIPRDIQTNKPVYVDITVTRKTDSGELIEEHLRAPCLMPEVNSIVKVCLNDARYWRIEIINKESLKRCLCQDQGYLSVKQKAHSSNNQLVQDIESYVLRKMPNGQIKARKSLALSECVQGDRVEQYSSLNELLTKLGKIDEQFKCLVLEQIRLASKLADRRDLGSKFNLLRPVIGAYNDELASGQIFQKWCKFLSKLSDWTNTSAQVAQYIALNDLSISKVDKGLLSVLQNLSIHSK